MPAGNPMAYADYRKARGGKDMSYEDYEKSAIDGGMSFMSKADYEKAEEAFGKSDLTIDADALIKAIDDYSTVEEALTTSGGSRESILSTKFRDGTITKAEQTELGAIMAGNAPAGGDTIRKSLADRMIDQEPEAAGLIDASDFLKSLVESSNEAMSDVASQVERDGVVTRNLLSAQGSLLKSTAHVMVQQSDMLKSQQVVINEMGRRLGVLEREPVVRKSQGTDPRDVAPRDTAGGGASGRGGPGARGDQLTKSQVLTGFRGLMHKADAANDSSAIDKLVHATALFESTGKVNPNIAGAIRMELGLNA